MRTESSYPTPVQGVSTLAPRNRARGQAGIQTNMRSDPVAKLTRRPSLRWDAFLLSTTQGTRHHSYYRREQEFRIIIEDGGTIHGFVDGKPKSITGNLNTYTDTSENLVIETINDTTFLVNPEKVVELSTNTDEATMPRVSHLNVVSALGYGEVLTLDLTGPSVDQQVVITIADATDADLADKQRRTNTVAAELKTLIDTLADPNIEVFNQGSTISVRHTNPNNWITLDVSSGDGQDNVAVFNNATEKVNGLPLYAYVGTRLTVQPDPTSLDGTYYLEAVGLDGEKTPTDPLKPMQEVVWTECRSPLEPYRFDELTMPHTIRYDYETDTFIAGPTEIDWEERNAGDNESCPPPVFVGRKIQALGQFQKRLVLISDNDVEMTVTDNLFNWWKQSAVDLLVTDPISITSNSVGIDILEYVIEHNRDLLIIASNGQFKIDGTQGVTPQTVAMPLTTSNEIQTTIPPVSIGSAVYMPISYGESTGLTEYTGLRNERDTATPITHHVIGYMKGEAKLLTGSSNLDMLAMTTTGAAQNEIFVYEQFSHQGERTQQSWSRWTLPEDNEILNLEFRRDRLTVTVKVGNDIILKQIEMYSRVAVNTYEVFLNDFMTLDSPDGLTATIPSTYPRDFIVVGADGTDYPLFKLPYTLSGDTITFPETLSKGQACKVYVGNPFRSEYQPTRPFRLDQEGIAITTDRLRVQKYIMNVVDTERLSMSIESPFMEYADQEVTFRKMGSTLNRLGEVNLFTGDMKFSYSQNAEQANALFYTEGFLGLTIAGISWAGQYHQTSGRI